MPPGAPPPLPPPGPTPGDPSYPSGEAAPTPPPAPPYPGYGAPTPPPAPSYPGYGAPTPPPQAPYPGYGAPTPPPAPPYPGYGGSTPPPLPPPGYAAYGQPGQPAGPSYNWGVPAPAPPRRRRPIVALGVITAVACVALAVGVGAIVRPDRIDYPDSWDPRVTDLVTFVERTRGLDFDHAVAINFLTDDEYAEASDAGTDMESSDVQDAAADDLAMFRALGLIEGDVDLAKAQDDLFDSGTLAYYDPEAKVVQVRGATITTATEVTLVHELTHVLQDQHFDLNAGFETGDPEAFRSVVEGDATAVENRYVEQLSPEAAAEYEAESMEQTQTATEALDESGVPNVLSSIFGSYYELGGPFVEMVLAQGGDDDLDELLRDPLTTTAPLFNPMLYFDEVEASTPTVDGVNDSKVIDISNFGAMWTYLTLSARTDDDVAMRATDEITGDELVRYRDGNTVCLRIALEARDDAGATKVAAAFDEWVAAMPAETEAKTVRDGSVVDVTTCDPGVDADLSVDPTTGDESVVPIIRSYFMSEAMRSGDEPASAFCTGDTIAVAVPIEVWQLDEPDTAATEQVTKAIGEAAQTC